MSYDWLPAVLSGLSSISSASGARAEGAYEAGMYRYNADISRRQAIDARLRGETTALQRVSSARSMVGSQRAALGAQGIDVSSGSALDVQVDTGKIAEMDIVTIRNNAAREAWGFETQAQDYENRAGLSLASAANRSRTTLLTGGLNALRLWNDR